MYLRVKIPAPILNIADFSSVFNVETGIIACDENGHIRALEFIALEGFLLEVERQISDTIFQIKTPIYPQGPLFVDKRFTEKAAKSESIRQAHGFDKKQPVGKLIERLLSFLGMSYLWGGNWSQGIPEMLFFYPPVNTLDVQSKDKWQLKGVDCSGLLFEITHGYLPRNTSQLISFGHSIGNVILSQNNLPLAKDVDMIISKVMPLDLIVYKGHVMIVLDRERLIESRENFGVVISPIKERLMKLQHNFYVRRWI